MLVRSFLDDLPAAAEHSECSDAEARQRLLCELYPIWNFPGPRHIEGVLIKVLNKHHVSRGDFCNYFLAHIEAFDISISGGQNFRMSDSGFLSETSKDLRQMNCRKSGPH